MYEDNATSMGGLVLECFMCGRLIIFPTHRPECLTNWNKHGKICLKCLLRWKFADANLEGYIVESELMAQEFGVF